MFFFFIFISFKCLNKSEDKKVADCYSGGLGYLLQIDAERITHKIRKPYPSWVPTIVYNDVSICRKISYCYVS